MVGVRPVLESVDGSGRVSGKDKEVSDEIFMGSFSEFGSPWENARVIQWGRRCVEV